VELRRAVGRTDDGEGMIFGGERGGRVAGEFNREFDLLNLFVLYFIHILFYISL